MEEELNKRADEKEVTLKEFLENQETVSEESSHFLDASSHLYMRVCPSARVSVSI